MYKIEPILNSLELSTLKTYLGHSRRKMVGEKKSTRRPSLGCLCILARRRRLSVQRSFSLSTITLSFSTIPPSTRFERPSRCPTSAVYVFLPSFDYFCRESTLHQTATRSLSLAQTARSQRIQLTRVRGSWSSPRCPSDRSHARRSQRSLSPRHTSESALFQLEPLTATTA